MKLLNRYTNGNYKVSIYDDGTKVRYSNDDYFNAIFPENIDLKITNWCNQNCPMCHENSSEYGKHSDLLNFGFINTLVQGTELALGGGKVTSHPDLIAFLEALKYKGIIANITVHQNEFMENQELISKLIEEKLIYGLGVSFSKRDDDFIKLVSQIPNAVIHVINGIHTQNDFEYLSNKGLKILILGYKELRRGIIYLQKESQLINSNKEWLRNNLKILLSSFKAISFDNLSLVQLNVEKLINKKEWDQFYMGDDGQHTMYIDLVEKNMPKILSHWKDMIYRIIL